MFMRCIFALVCIALVEASMLCAQDRDSPLSTMAQIPGGTYVIGTDASKVAAIANAFGVGAHPDLISAETPSHSVTLASFYIDRYEVTNEEFAKFLKKNSRWLAARIPKGFDNGNYLKDWNGSKFPGTKGNYPVANVSWYAAVAYCRSLGKRLPTEAEWEVAARGGLIDRTFPWGDQAPNKARANFGESELKTTTPVGSYPANGYGLFDMAGNVWEFVADEWGPYNSAAAANPIGGNNRFLDDSYLKVMTRRVIRGGSYGGAPLNLRVTYRDSHPPNGSQAFVGFRCAR